MLQTQLCQGHRLRKTRNPTKKTKNKDKELRPRPNKEEDPDPTKKKKEKEEEDPSGGAAYTYHDCSGSRGRLTGCCC